MFTKIHACRICRNTTLVPVLDLGEQMLTGVFPKEKDESITTGPLRLVKCVGDIKACGLLQLEHSYSLEEMYGENYGYRSGLNSSMVQHLHEKVKKILHKIELLEDDIVLDIGSNDSTTLQAYPANKSLLVGMDPTGAKFKEYYPAHIQLIPNFFSSEIFKKHFGDKKAKVITSFSMFYDLEDPTDFMQEIYEVLENDGIWVFEQSYMPTMLETNSYDTVCHEHLEFYALHQIKWMTDKVGFKIIDVELNDINGGSFSVTVSKESSDYNISKSVQKVLKLESEKGLNTLKPYETFAKNAKTSKQDILDFIKNARTNGKSIAALGASTKGNVLLQYCGLTENDIISIGDVNSDKYGCYTPGTWIPIIPENEVINMNPDFLIVLPWHFRSFFTSNEKFSKLRLVFPLPQVEIV